MAVGGRAAKSLLAALVLLNLISYMSIQDRVFRDKSALTGLVQLGVGAFQEVAPRSREDVYRERNQLISDVCAKYGIPFDIRGRGRQQAPEQPNHYQEQWKGFTLKARMQNSFIYNDKKKLSYCWNRKVASTSWQRVFFELAGKKVSPQQAHTGVERFRPKPDLVRDALFSDPASPDSGLTRFFFVRHPFDRLASAYVQKFELGYKNDWMFKNYVSKIFAANHLSYDKKLQPRPTFSQLVEYLLGLPSVTAIDDHLRPQWLHCHVCSIHYNVPGLLETVADDSQYIAGRANLTRLSLPWNNKSATVHRSNRTHAALEDYFVKDLSRGQVKRLVELYRPDFEMFGYSWEAYMPPPPPEESGEET